ncbi:MAG: MFS transporter [Patescibacteria group bacterium]
MLNVFLLGLTSLLADFSSEMVVPILPFFIQAVGGAGVAIGLTFGIGDAVASLIKVFSGHWADKTKQYKLFVVLGYLFSAVAKFIYPLANSWSQIAIIRPVERIGKGFRDAPRDAIVSESLNDHNRGRGFGIQRAMDSIGAIIGSVAVLVLFVVYQIPFRTIFLISAHLAIFAVVPILFVKVPRELKIANRRSISFSRLSSKVRTFIVIATVFALANFSVAFFILKTQSAFTGLDERQALGLALLLYIFFGVFDAVFSEPAGALSDRIGRRRVIIMGYVVFSIVCLGFLWLSVGMHSNATEFAILLGLFALYGIFKALIDASQRAFVSDLSDADIRGTALGTFETATGLAAIPAGLVAGVLWNITPAYTFLFGFGLSLIAVLLLATSIREYK